MNTQSTVNIALMSSIKKGKVPAIINIVRHSNDGFFVQMQDGSVWRVDAPVKVTE